MKILSTYNPEYLKTVLSFIRMFPSLHIGGSAYHTLLPRRASLILYITNRCNSRCLACNHWKQTPKKDLTLEAIEGLARSHTLRGSDFLIEGGEAILHPEFDQILDCLKGRHINLLTNGILTERIVEAVEKHRVPSVGISLDGTRETYEKMRGVDAYDQVLQTIDRLKHKTSLTVSLTITPWNTYEDYRHVLKLCEGMKARLQLGIFASMDYMGVTGRELPIDPRYESLENPYISTYNTWVEGKISPPCYSMRLVSVIRPNGDVALCQHKDVILGNIYQKPFDEIWNDEKTKAVQRAHRHCNDCWVASHRSFDVKLDLLLKKVLPARLYRTVTEMI